MNKAKPKERRIRKRSRYQALHTGLDTFGMWMTVGCVILMFGFVVLQIVDHILRK